VDCGLSAEREGRKCGTGSLGRSELLLVVLLAGALRLRGGSTPQGSNE